MKVSECINQLNFNIEYNRALANEYAEKFYKKVKKLKPWQKIFTFFMKKDLKKAELYYKQAGSSVKLLMKYRKEANDRDLTNNELKEFHKTVGEK